MKTKTCSQCKWFVHEYNADGTPRTIGMCCAPIPEYILKAQKPPPDKATLFEETMNYAEECEAFRPRPNMEQ